MKLTIELVPSTTWYNNVRSLVSQTEWDTLRHNCYANAGYRCEICGVSGRLECHEIWEFNNDTKTQRLAGLIALCKNCHRVKHPGLAKMKGESSLVINHLMKINKITESQAIEYIEKSFEIWRERSKIDWHIDFSILNKETLCS